MGSENLVPIDYSGQKGWRYRIFNVVWYQFHMGKHCILLPSNCSLMICQLPWWQQWQSLDVLCCANIRFHEVGLLAETVNQCRPKTPQGKTLLLSGQVNSVTWWQCSPAVPAQLCQDVGWGHTERHLGQRCTWGTSCSSSLVTQNWQC